MFDRHAEVLQEVYGPKDMMSLRRAHMATEDLARRTLSGTKGATIEDMARELRYAEIGLKSVFGGLRGGNMFRNLKLAIKSVPGLDSEPKIAAVIRQAMFDPKLASHLLDAEVHEVGKPRWNSRLAQLLTLAEVSRNAQKQNEDK